MPPQMLRSCTVTMTMIVTRILLPLLLLTCPSVISGLRFSSELTDQVAVLSKPFWWTCDVTDTISDVTYTWTLNQQPLPLNVNQVIYSNGTLYIGRLTTAEVGVYVCRATSGGESVTSREARLDVAYIDPGFGTSPVSQTVFLGTTVKLSCQITSLPTALVSWTMDGKNVTWGTITASLTGESTLALSPVLYHDAGVYKCTGTNPLLNVYRYSTEATLIVQGRPMFLSSLQPVSVPLGFTATFNCRFHGNPTPSVIWLLHRTMEGGAVSTAELQNSEKYRFYENGTLHVFDVSYEDEGFYTCNVENIFGEMSESAKLTCTGVATLPEITRKPVNTNVRVGRVAMFDCSCGGNPEPKLYWYKTGSKLISRGSLTLHENGSLSLSVVQSTDMDWYTCVCENAIGSTNKSVFLNVQVAPTITVSPSNAVVVGGDTLMLHCHTEGNPNPQVTWLTPYLVEISTTRPVSGYNVFQNGSLQLTNTDTEDAGKYMCSAGNILGTVNQSVTVRVEVPPEFSTLPVSQSVHQGEKAYFHCQAKGVPSPAYTWHKDREGAIRSTGQRQIFLNNTLVIHAVMLQDAGIYTCTATNSRGQISSVATLTVLVRPSFSVKPANQKVRVGGTVQLNCLAEGHPVPTQWWLKDGRTLNLDDNMSTLPDNTMLTIAGITEAQFGRYECVASNIAGTVSVAAWIETRSLPVFTVMPSNTTIKKGESLYLRCQGQAEEPTVTRWYRESAGERTLLKSSDRVKVTYSGDLTIMKVEADEAGWYTCVVGNSVGEISTDVHVDVQTPARVTLTNSPQRVLIQYSVTLICQFTGNPNPVLQWVSPHGVLVEESSAYHLSETALEIAAANESRDAGKWFCRACNILECDGDNVELIIEGFPKIGRFYGSKVGDIVTLTCDVTGDPESDVTFTSEGQTVTMGTEGHRVKGNSLSIAKEFVRPEYTCNANNAYGSISQTLTVPAKMTVPIVTNIGSSWVTLQWSAPLTTSSDLPLSGYVIQTLASHESVWEDVAMTTPDMLTSKQMNISDLDLYTLYRFRISARNWLGRGAFSDASSSIRSLPGAPSPPSNVITLELSDYVYLVVWDPPVQPNGPINDIGYDYKVTTVIHSAIWRENIEVIQSQGRLLHNHSRELEINVPKRQGRYVVSLTAVNTQINLSSPVYTVDIDTSISGEQQNISRGSDSNPGKIIAIVFGIIGGLVIVLVLIFIVKYVRARQKSESMSLVNPRLPLDQFYMENPKDLYRSDSRMSIKRRSGHSFYSFQEDDSFHGSRSMLKDGGTPKKRGKKDNDVLLVSRNPLYHDTDVKTLSVINSRETTPEHQETNPEEESCIQSEITAPVSEVTEHQSHNSTDIGSDVTGTGSEVTEKDANSTKRTEEAITPLSAKDLEEDIMKLYSSMNDDSSGSTQVYQQEQPQEHIYSSIHSEGQRSRSQGSSSPATTHQPGSESTFILQKPNVTVPSSDCEHSVTNGETNGTREPYSQNEKSQSNRQCCESNKNKNRTEPNGARHSNLPKPPTKVLSLEGLRPNNAKVPKGQNKTKHVISEDSVPLFHHVNSEDSVPLFHHKPNKQISSENKVNNDENSSDTDSLFAGKGGKQVDRVRPLDIRIEDNLLSDEEFQRDLVTADLY